jgi:hypothetical protein
MARPSPGAMPAATGPRPARPCAGHHRHHTPAHLQHQHDQDDQDDRPNHGSAGRGWPGGGCLFAPWLCLWWVVTPDQGRGKAFAWCHTSGYRPAPCPALSWAPSPPRTGTPPAPARPGRQASPWACGAGLGLACRTFGAICPHCPQPRGRCPHPNCGQLSSMYSMTYRAFQACPHCPHCFMGHTLADLRGCCASMRG